MVFGTTVISSAPSPPRSVSVRIVAPYVVEVSWREPAEPNGIVRNYTVYVTPVPDSPLGTNINVPQRPDPMKMVRIAS